MSDYISRKALLKWASNRKSMHRTSMPYDMGIVFMCDSLAAEIISGRFDIPSPAEGEMKVLFDGLADLEELDAELSRLRAAEGRYREHIEGIHRIIMSAYGYDMPENIRSILISAEWACAEALSPIGEQKEDTGPSKSTLGLMTKEDKNMDQIKVAIEAIEDEMCDDFSTRAERINKRLAELRAALGMPEPPALEATPDAK